MLYYLCIKSRADALANLPVPGQGGFRESGDVAAPATKRGRHSSALLGANRWRVFQCAASTTRRQATSGPCAAARPGARARTVSYQGKTTFVMTDRQATPVTTRMTA